jgi:hypothetical protein
MQHDGCPSPPAGLTTAEAREKPAGRQPTASSADALLGEPLKRLAQILVCRARIDRAKA